MSAQDAIFYGLDIVILVMITRMILATRKIIIPTDMGFRWIVPVLFFVIAVIGYFRYEGVFRIIQSLLLIVMGIGYYFVGSGVSEEGLIMMGRLYRFMDMEEIKVDYEHWSLRFRVKKKTIEIMFQEKRLEEAVQFLKEKKLYQEKK